MKQIDLPLRLTDQDHGEWEIDFGAAAGRLRLGLALQGPVPPSPTCLKLGLPAPVGCARYKG